MKDDLNNYIQDIDTDTESRVEWVMRDEDDEDLDKKDPKKEKGEKQDGELEEIEKNIVEQQEKIEKIQTMLYYFESGEAYRENEEQFEAGDIKEDEYIANKKTLDLEFDQSRLDLKEATIMLQDLFARKGKITGIREENKLEEERVNHKLVEMANESEELFENGQKEKVQNEESIKEDIENENISGDQIFENNVSNGNSSNLQNGVPDRIFNSANSNIPQSNGAKEQEQDIGKNTTQQLDLYRKQNAFMSLVRKVIAKIKAFNDRADSDKLEEVALEEMNKQGNNLDTVNLDENTLGDSLSVHVCSKEEIINNINERENLEVDEKEVKRNIDDVII